MASTEVKSFLAQIDNSQLVEFRKRDKLKAVLNVSPPKEWIKDHPFVKGVKYLPIDKVECLLDSIFQEWQVEIKSISQLAQSICAVVRLHYKDPINGEWKFHDGVGAIALKTDKGYSAADLEHIKSNAVETGAPAAVSFAIKDAADHLGDLFGKNLNRIDVANNLSLYDEAGYGIAERQLADLRVSVAHIIEKNEPDTNFYEALKRAKRMTLKELEGYRDDKTKDGEGEDANQG